MSNGNMVQVPPGAVVRTTLERKGFNKYVARVVIETEMDAVIMNRKYGSEKVTETEFKHAVKIQRKEIERMDTLMPEVKKDLVRAKREQEELFAKFEKWAVEISKEFPELGKDQVLQQIHLLHRGGEKDVRETTVKNARLEASKIRVELKKVTKDLKSAEKDMIKEAEKTKEVGK